ncbi:MAG: ImmA/IrrE family metallo-endopeptidase [Chloroflexi bacterium]|nr:ImmA/IrrE family metallo-endopeptidase [Chloroflexota bacterium]
MDKEIRAPFNPEMLTLARESRGISQRELASMLSVSPGWLSKVEGGIKYLPDDRLAQIAELLDYPTSFFRMHRRVYGPGISELFHRRRRNTMPRTLDKHQAQIEIRRMHIEDLLKGVDIGEPEIRTYDLYEFNGSPSEIARAVRATWQMPRGPVMNVTEAIEYARGIVVPMNFETPLIDATSCWPPKLPPLFFVNSLSPGDRLRFSLAHELGHIVMHQDTPNPLMEQQANEFAAEFLMPEETIRPYLAELSLEKMATLKPYWKVSMAALLKRAMDVNMITPRHAKTLWMQLGKAGYRLREPVELDIPVEKPELLTEIMGIYAGEMDYTFSDLADLLRLHEHEVCHIYFGAALNAQHEDARAAIAEAERIISKYRRT